MKRAEAVLVTPFPRPYHNREGSSTMGQSSIPNRFAARNCEHPHPSTILRQVRDALLALRTISSLENHLIELEEIELIAAALRRELAERA